MVHVASDGAILLANAFAQRFLGLAYDELTRGYTVDYRGRTCFEDGRECPPEDYPVTRCLVSGEPAGPTTIGVEQPSGELRWAVFRAAPVELADGRGAVVTFLDITERKVAEEQRQAALQQLQQADRMSSLGMLAASVAHEVNNPLTYVLGYLSRARAELEGGPGARPEVAAMLADAEEGALRVGRIVRGLGRLSRVDSGALGPVDVASAVGVALSMTRAALRPRAEVGLELDADAGPLIVLADEGRLVQLLVNLLTNAAQAIEPGHRVEHRVAVAVRRASRVDDGTAAERILVEVADTGCGMSEEQLAQACDPFFTTKPVGQGTGLGLAICRRVVDELAGDLELVSAPGEGTTARVWLHAAPADQVAPPRHPRETPTPSRRLSILVVDDEVAILDFLRSVLEDQDATFVTSGREAIELAASRSFDAVICDLTMPELTGVDVWRELERQGRGLHRRMLLITGGAFSARARAFIDEAAPAMLNKPFTGPELRGALVQLVEPTQ